MSNHTNYYVVLCCVVLYIIFEPGYRDPHEVAELEGYSHIWLIWEFSENEAAGWSPMVCPPRLGGRTFLNATCRANVTLRVNVTCQMESFSTEMSQKDSDFLEQTKVENRRKYDYRSFLRKFAALHEEMHVDPDTFDYVLYTFGLSHGSPAAGPRIGIQTAGSLSRRTGRSAFRPSRRAGRLPPSRSG